MVSPTSLAGRPRTGLGVDIHESLIPEVVSRHELPRGPVDLPEDAELAHLEERASAVVIDENTLEHFVQVVGFARHELLVPPDRTGVRVQSQRTVRVQRIAVGTARDAGPWLGLSGRPIHQVRLRVVAARNPRVPTRGASRSVALT